MPWSASTSAMSSSAPREPAMGEEKKPTVIPTASAVLPTGELVEMVYDPLERKTRFVCGAADAWGYEENVLASPSEQLVPYSPTNNLVKHNVCCFRPSPSNTATKPRLSLVSGT